MICKTCGTEYEGIFCPNCGTDNTQGGNSSNDTRKGDVVENELPSADIEKTLQDIDFYYELSQERKECTKENESTEYYDRGQTKALTMLKYAPKDYRIWWEASKPVDYWNTEESIAPNDTDFNKLYFDKALDLASLEEKEVLINDVDAYRQRKKVKKQKEEERIIAERKQKEEERLLAEQKQKEDEDRVRLEVRDGIIDGLGKFGIKADEDIDLFGDQKNTNAQETVVDELKEITLKSESELVLEKTIRCPVCNKIFRTLQPKSERVKRLESDQDLRPRCEGIDIMKYNVNCCSFCGYTALASGKYFETISMDQKKLVEEKICKTFEPNSVANAFESEVKEWDYDTAITLHQLSFYNAVVKEAKTSEKAYNCLVLSWLLRGKAESIATGSVSRDEIERIKKQEAEYYKEAYEGLSKAVETEDFPIAGMDQSTMDYLLAAMAFQLGDTRAATRSLSRILNNPPMDSKLREKARDLKDEIIACSQKNG